MMKHITALFLLLLVLTGLFATSAAAANVCTEVRGGPSKSVTFTLTTKRGWTGQKITLKQSKGKAKGQHWFGGQDKTYQVYGTYRVSCTDLSNGKTTYKNWYTSSCSLYLKANRTYRITVTWDQGLQHIRYRSLYNGGFYGWVSQPSWWVKSTRNVVLCH